MKKSAPAQIKLLNEIQISTNQQQTLVTQVDQLKAAKEVLDDDEETVNKIEYKIGKLNYSYKQARKKEKNLTIKLKRLKSNNIRMQLWRKKQKKLTTTTNYKEPGRPRLLPEDFAAKFEFCLKDIQQRAQERRKDSNVRVPVTINQLRERFNENNPSLALKNPQTFYNYLLPKRRNTIEAKRHHSNATIRVVPVKETVHEEHPDFHFCCATLKFFKKFFTQENLKEFVHFTSMDDKAKVPLG